MTNDEREKFRKDMLASGNLLIEAKMHLGDDVICKGVWIGGSKEKSKDELSSEIERATRVLGRAFQYLINNKEVANDSNN